MIDFISVKGTTVALTLEEQAYLDNRPMTRLTFDGVNDLYKHPLYGSYSIRQCIELEAVRSLPQKPRVVYPAIIPVSDELERCHQYCIDTYGCGMF